jgi:hypothetical protein
MLPRLFDTVQGPRRAYSSLISLCISSIAVPLVLVSDLSGFCCALSLTAQNQSTAVPAAVSRGRQAATQRGDISKFDVEINAQSRVGQVSVAVLSKSLVIITNDPRL